MIHTYIYLRPIIKGYFQDAIKLSFPRLLLFVILVLNILYGWLYLVVNETYFQAAIQLSFPRLLPFSPKLHSIYYMDDSTFVVKWNIFTGCNKTILFLACFILSTNYYSIYYMDDHTLWLKETYFQDTIQLYSLLLFFQTPFNILQGWFYLVVKWNIFTGCNTLPFPCPCLLLFVKLVFNIYIIWMIILCGWNNNIVRMQYNCNVVACFF